MKKTLISLAFVCMFFAPLTHAATMAELENQRIQLLEQIIVLLKARISELTAVKNSASPTQTVGASLSLNTGENVSTTPAKPVKKKRSGGGGGSSRKSAPEIVTFAPFVTEFYMGSTEFNFEVPVHVFFAPESITTVLDLHDIPWWFTLPTTFTIKVPMSDGSVSDVVMVFEKGSKYVADMNPTLLGGKQYVPDLARIINETVKILDIPFVVMDEESIFVDIYPEDYPVEQMYTLELDASYEDPDSTTFMMEEDAQYPMFAFTVGAVEEDAYISLDEINVDIAITGIGDILDIVDEFLLEINGNIFEADINDVTSESAILSFDLADLVEMDNDDETDDAYPALTGMVYVIFYDEDDEDFHGATIRASLAPENIVGTHALYVGEEVYGSVHTLRTAGLQVEFADEYVELFENSSLTTTDNSAVFELEFDVTAFWSDVLVPFGTSNIKSLTPGILFSIVDSNGDVVTTGSVVATLDSNANIEGDAYDVEEGETEDFELEVVFDPISSGSYMLRLDGINFIPENGSTSAMEFYDTEELSIETNFVFIQN